MNTEEALDFLRRHQPLPPSREMDNSLLSQFEEVRQYFTKLHDDRCIPLLIGALGQGDGHGVYQMVETTLLDYPEEAVVAEIALGLASPHASVRYWCAQFASNFPKEELLKPLANVCRFGGIDEGIAAVTAIESIGTPEADHRLREMLSLNLHLPVRQLVMEILRARG